MALFGGKKKPAEPQIDPAVERRNQAWAKLDQHIDSNPLFALQTFDHLNWIDPFSGEIVPAPFGHAEVARQYYAQHEHWMKSQTKPPTELQAVQWFHWIKLNIRSDDRLRIFNPNGCWLNPKSGSFSQQTRRVDGKVGASTLRSMAEELVAAGAKRPEDLLSLDQLKQRCGGPDGEDSDVAPIIGGGDFDAGNGVAVESTDSFRAPASPGQRTGSDRLRAIGRAVGNDQAIGGLRSLFAKVGTDQAQQTSDDLERARQVQLNMLPAIPDLPDYDLAIRYDPYDAIGGDLYEIARLGDGRLLIVVGDVTGHGVQAALVTSSMIKALRYIARQEQDLVEIICALNDNAKEDLISGQFVTIWAGILDTTSHQLEAICAGHHRALLGNPAKDVLLERFSHTGPAIGLMSSTLLRKHLRTEVRQLEPGDVVLQYTDGLSELRHPERGQYGDFRVMGSMLAHLDQEPQAIIDGMVETATAFAGAKPDDDLTLLLLRLHAAAAAPSPAAAGE